MKKVLLFSLSLITLISCEHDPVEGCTDPNAINYNIHADVNNNTCDFSSDIIFYLDQNAGIFLYNQGVQELTFYIDGYNIGSQYNNGGFYTSQVDPECFNSFYTTGTTYWSGSSYTNITWEVIDNNGTIWYNASSYLVANECLAIQLTAKKLQEFQNNN